MSDLNIAFEILTGSVTYRYDSIRQPTTISMPLVPNKFFWNWIGGLYALCSYFLYMRVLTRVYLWMIMLKGLERLGREYSGNVRLKVKGTHVNIESVEKAGFPTKASEFF